MDSLLGKKLSGKISDWLGKKKKKLESLKTTRTTEEEIAYFVIQHYIAATGMNLVQFALKVFDFCIHKGQILGCLNFQLGELSVIFQFQLIHMSVS